MSGKQKRWEGGERKGKERKRVETGMAQWVRTLGT